MFFFTKSKVSIPNFAARSSSAHMVSTHIWGWFGARQARAGPMWFTTPTYCFCWLGTFQTYGIASDPGAGVAPDPSADDSEVGRVHSFLARPFAWIEAVGGHPAVSSSVARLSTIFTGRPRPFLESCAAATPQGSRPSLLPNPPPTWS